MEFFRAWEADFLKILFINLKVCFGSLLMGGSLLEKGSLANEINKCYN